MGSSWNWHLPVCFALLAFIALVDLGFSASLVSDGNKHGYWSGAEKTRTRFNLFVAVWTVILSCVFLGIALVSSLFSWLHHIVFLAITFIFWIASAASLTTLYQSVDNCSATGRFSGCHKVETASILSYIAAVITLILIVLWATFGRADRYSRNNVTHA